MEGSFLGWGINSRIQIVDRVQRARRQSACWSAVSVAHMLEESRPLTRRWKSKFNVRITGSLFLPEAHTDLDSLTAVPRCVRGTQARPDRESANKTEVGGQAGGRLRRAFRANGGHIRNRVKSTAFDTPTHHQVDPKHITVAATLEVRTCQEFGAVADPSFHIPDLRAHLSHQVPG